MQIHELNTFNGKPGEFDFLAIDNGYDTAKIGAKKLLGNKLNQPLDANEDPDNGTNGQLLRTNGDGTTSWVDEGLPTDAQTAAALSDWLNDHPEAVTTVQDGSITEAKLNSALKERLVFAFDDVSTMKSYTGLIVGNLCRTQYFADASAGGGAWYIIKSTGTDNGMDVIALDSGLYAHLVITEGRITPEMLGYTSGDAWTFIKRCIESDASEIVLNGSYTITHNDETYSGGLFVGNQITANNKYIHGTGDIFVTPDDAQRCPFVFLNTSNLIVEGLTITSDMTSHDGVVPGGHRRTAKSSNVVAFGLYDTCSNIVFKDLSFNGCHWCFGFSRLGTNNYATIEDVLIENCHSIHSGGMFINCNGTDRLTISGSSNIITEQCVGGHHFLYSHKYCDNIVIENCYNDDGGYTSPAIQHSDSASSNGGSVRVSNSTFRVAGLATSNRASASSMTFDNCDVTLLGRYLDDDPTYIVYPQIITVANDSCEYSLNNCNLRDGSTDQNGLITNHGASASDSVCKFNNCTIESAMLICRGYYLYCDVIFNGCHFTSGSYTGKALFRLLYGDGTIKCIGCIFETIGYAAPQGAGQIVLISNCCLNIGYTGGSNYNFLPNYTTYSGKLILTNNLIRKLSITPPEGLSDTVINYNAAWS